MVNNNGMTQYTRAGSFQVDLAGNLLTPSGQQVQGWMATNGVVNTGGPVGNITVPVGSMQPPVATQNMTLSANFDASAATGTASDWSAPITVYDSLGTTHVLTLNFEQTAANTWSCQATVPGADVQGGTAGTPSAVGSPIALQFSGSGLLTGTTPAEPINFAFQPANGATAISINWNPIAADGTSTLTQFDQSSATSAIAQDGSAAAQLTAVTMANGGRLLATYSNGQQTVVGQLAIANIQNPQTLVNVGNNNFQVTADTGAPAVGAPGTGGRGTVVGGALESECAAALKSFFADRRRAVREARNAARGEPGPAEPL